MPTIPCHAAVTTLTEIKHDRVSDLRGLLATIDADVENNSIVPFARFSGVHFARFVILDAVRDLHGHDIPAQLLFATDHDTPTSDHLDQLLSVAQAGFLKIYSHCVGFDDTTAPDALKRHWMNRNLHVGAAFCGTPDKSLPELRDEALLQERLAALVRTERTNWLNAGLTPDRIHGAIKKAIHDDGSFSWVWKRPKSAWTDRIRWMFGLAAPLVVAIAVVSELRRFDLGVVVGIGVATLVAFLVLLRRAEIHNPQMSDDYDDQHVRTLTDREDFVVQNQMSGVVFVQPGLFRQLTLRAVLYIINSAATYRYTRGTLGSIPSIHFARWVLIDDGRRLLFLSNFDGSWESYLGDFIDKAAFGLTLVWSNCWGFPKTEWLGLRGGARDALRFKAYARQSQTITDVWYSAHKQWSIQNLTQNSAIRAGLRDPLSPEECAAWCALL